jgi:uncharacterized membrane protein YfhO
MDNKPNNHDENSFVYRFRKNKRLTYYTVYTAVFLFTSALVFSWFFFNRKSFVWKTDGLTQHLNSLIYFGKYLRHIVYHFLNTGKIIIPMFDFSIGYGSDILTTLHYYVIGDPLNLLSVFVPASKTEYLYNFLVIVRLYLSGIAFSAYCEKINKPRFAMLCGSLIYAFCGFSLYAAVRHPYFINPMIYFPLLLIGIEKIFERQRPYLFIVMVCISAVSSFYFFYMLSILIFIYAVIRFFSIYEKDRIKNIFKYLGRFTLYYSTGLLIACIMFLPVVILTLSTNRMDIRHIVPIIYPKSYYIKFLAGFITMGSPGSWVCLGYPGVSLIAVIYFLSQKKANRYIKIWFTLLTLFLMLPVMGHILHGFSYVSNRWIWGYSFVVALITVIMIPDILEIKKKQLTIISVFLFLYFYAGMMLVFIEKAFAIAFMGSFAIVAMTVLFLYVFNKFDVNDNKSTVIRYVPRIVMLILIIINIVILAGSKYSPKYGKYVNEFGDSNKSFNILSGYPSRAVHKIKDLSFYRFDEHIPKNIWNQSMFNRENSLNFYFSLNNYVISDLYINDMDLFFETSFRYKNFDNRIVLDSLASVKYFVINSGAEQYLPYGFDRLVHKSSDYLVYENANTLPLGYTYENIIPKTEYKKLSAIEKQQALLQGAVINNAESSPLNAVNPVFNHTVIPYKLEYGNGIKYNNGVFVVNDTSSSVTLKFEGFADCETYLYIKNLHYLKEKISISSITINSGDISRIIDYKTPYYTWYNNQHNFMINLGYNKEPRTTVKITFKQKGKYTFDSLELICQPVSGFERQIEKLKETVLENVKIETNFITGTIRTDRDKMLCFSIPYSKGWRAYIDGKEVEMLNINTMYCGFFLPVGNHNIELKYMTPYLKQGGFLSLVGLCLLVVITAYYEKKMRK